MAESSSKKRNPHGPNARRWKRSLVLNKNKENSIRADEFVFDGDSPLRIHGFLVPKWPITVLDPCNGKEYKVAEARLKRWHFLDGKYLTPMGGQDDLEETREFVETCKEITCSDVRLLRAKMPTAIPVSVVKDPRSGIPDIECKKYHVPFYVPLGEFVDYIRRAINYTGTMLVYFKNTQPPTDAWISAIDKENVDEDGFLHMTYSDTEREIVRMDSMKNKKSLASRSQVK